MTIAIAELTIPGTIAEIERNAARAIHVMPRRPARWSVRRWRIGRRG